MFVVELDVGYGYDVVCFDFGLVEVVVDDGGVDVWVEYGY